VKRSWRVIVSACAILVCFLLTAPVSIGEDAPSIRDRKGFVPAEGTWLDRDSYADGSVYENPPTDVEFVRIGLCYGDNAADYAIFENTNDNGFSIGAYDWQRHFVEYFTTNYDSLTVIYSDDEEEGLMILGGEDQEFVYQSGAEAALAIEPIAGNTLYRDATYLGGFECRKTYDHRMIVVNCVGLENYVKGVVPYEMAIGWPKEALKAQAVCARTYVVYNQNKFAEYGFDLTDSTLSQVYRGIDGANWWTDAAVDETRGELIRYEGEVCEIYYSAGDGGATEDGRYVFDADHPYLCGKLDPFEAAEDYYYKSWSYAYDGEEIMTRLAVKQFELDKVVELVPEYSALGNVIAITFVDEDGDSLRLEGRSCYTVLGLPSCHFQVSNDKDGFLFEGSGLGHSCGMSQWGAKAMDEVYGYDYNDIIRFYFTGAYIA
jgi:stage II sporulation protein D